MLFFLIPYLWATLKDRLSGRLAEPHILLAEYSWPGVWVLEKPALPAWCVPTAYPGCVLSPSTLSQDTVAKCCLPSSCWTTRVLFPEVMTGPSSSGISAAKSVRKFSLSVCLYN